MAYPIPASTAHAICLGLFLLDNAVRAVRLQILVRAFGGQLGFWRAIAANFVEEAAAGLTPMRVGSTAGRAVMLLRDGVSVRVTVQAGVVESSIMAPLVTVCMVAVGLVFGHDWWHTVGPRLEHAARRAAPWLVLGVVLGVVAWVLARRFVPHHHHSFKRTVVHAAQEVRRLRPSVLVLVLLLTVVDLVARVAILPVLALAVWRTPALGPAILGSFVLLFGQLLVPTPSGAGAVEVGVLAGGGGVTGAAATWLLLAWRLYTTFAPVGLGAVIGAVVGARHLRARRRAQAVLATEVASAPVAQPKRPVM